MQLHKYEKSPRGLKLFTIWLLLSTKFTSAASHCGSYFRDVVHDIELEEGKPHTLSPKKWQLNDSAPNSTLCGKVIYYNFKPPRGINHSVSVKFIFQEFYHNLKVMLCGTSHENQISAAEAASNFYVLKHSADTPIFKNSCEWYNPVKCPVFSAIPPVFLALWRPYPSSPVAERVHLVNKKETVLYNVTYEIILDDSPSLIDTTKIRSLDSCNLNGKPILHKVNESWYEFRCNCLLDTYGEECQWGPSCSPQNARAPCDNRGTCRSISNLEGNYYACICDKDHFGPKCIHYTAFRTLDNCYNDTCHYCHQLPNGDHRCSCKIEYKLSSSGQCVEDSMDVFLKYEKLEDFPLTKSVVASEIKHLFLCSEHFQRLDLVKHMTINEDSFQIRLNNLSSLTNLTSLTFDQLNNEKIWSGQLDNPCQGESANQKEDVITRKTIDATTEISAFNRQLKFSLIRIQYSRSVIEQVFRRAFFDDYFELCCCTTSTDLKITFLKEGNKINEKPFIVRSSSTDENWQRGAIKMLSWPRCICLRFKQVTTDDNGIYTCRVEDEYFLEEKNLYIAKESSFLEVEADPENVTVLQGENVTVSCSVVNKAFWWSHSKIEIFANPISSYNEFSTYPINARKSSITLFNVQNNITLLCKASEEFGSGSRYGEKTVSVWAFPKNYPVCGEDSSFGMKWPMAKENTNVRTKCPGHYTGFCERKCITGEREELKTTWQLPDCSDCQRDNISKILKNVTMYRRGIHSYLIHPELVLKEIENALSRYEDFVPGEMSPILKSISEYLSMTSINFAFEDVYSLLSRIISKNNSLTEKDFVVMQRLVKSLPLRYHKTKCLMKFFEDDSLAGYFRGLLSVCPSHNISFPLNKTKAVQVTGSRQRFFREKHFNKFENFTKINVIIRDNGKTPKVLFVTVYRKPDAFLRYKKKVSIQEDTIGVNRDFDRSSLFGKTASPLVQIDLYEDDPPGLRTSEGSRIAIEFDQCFPTDQKGLKCARYLPGENIWDSKGCAFSNLEKKKCTCLCENFDGWIGLVRINDASPSQVDQMWDANSVVAAGCSLAILLLSLTTVVVLIRCILYSRGLLPRVVEVLALLITNLLFLYSAIIKPSKEDLMPLLMVISASLVLSLGISVTHQVEILHSYSSYLNSSPRTSSVMQPAFLLTIVSGLIAVLLGFILWTIGKVQLISLTHAWLPDGDKASSLTLVVLCYISALFLLFCVPAALNWLRLKNSLLVSSSWIAEHLIVDLKRHCALALLKFIYIMTGIYRDSEVGRFLFMITSICLGFSVLFLYTCESLWSTKTFQTISQARCKEKDHIKRKKVDASEGCLWNWLFSSSVIYSGVAVTEISHLPAEESVEFRRRADSLWSQNLPPQNGDENEQHSVNIKNGHSCKVPPSALMMPELGNSAHTDRTPASSRQKKHLIDNLDEYPNQGSLIVPDETHFQTYDETVHPNGKSPLAIHFSHGLSHVSSTPGQNYLQVLEKCNNDCSSRRYLCMKGHRAKVELKTSIEVPQSGNEIPSKTLILYENAPSNRMKKLQKCDKGKVKRLQSDPFFDQSNYLKFETWSLSRLNSETNEGNTFTLPRHERGKKIFSTFSSKVSLLGSKTKKAHKSLTSGRTSNSSDNFEKSILIENARSLSPTVKQVISQESVIRPKENYTGHRRQHSL